MASSSTHAATASAELPSRLSCEFTMPSCEHAAIFNDVYLRTNRTNHTKIMRCFPHCCPEHRRRSYCGSSLHLKVQPPADHDSSKPLDKLVVYARFRPAHVEAMPTGSIVSLQSVQASLQSKDPSKGEWIECVAVKPAKSAPPTTASMYEVNPSGRWYYPWSGAATIAMRATEHVFEALVFRRVSPKQLELVSYTTSSLFRLMSFRRGLATASSSKAGADASDESPRKSPQKLKSAPRAASPTDRGFALNSIGRPPAASASEAYARIEIQDHGLYARYPGDRSRPHDYVFPPIQLPAREAFRTPPSASHSYTNDVFDSQYPPPEASTIPIMETLTRWLHATPANSAGSRLMLAWQTIVQRACKSQLAAAHEVASVRAGLVPILSALDIAIAPSAVARGSAPAMFGAPGPASPLNYMDAAVRVLLHEWLDIDCTRASGAVAERLVLNGYSPHRAELAVAHEEWLQDVVARAQRFVHAHTRTSWSQLMVAISQFADDRQQRRLPDDGSAFSHRSFVAQYRQLYTFQPQRHGSTSRKPKRRRMETPPSSYRTHSLLQSAPVWTSRMEDVSIEMDGMSQHSLSLLTVVQFWKHLCCLRLDFSPSTTGPAGPPAQLSVASVFNSLVSDGCFTKLTLDGQYRWFNCLPSGEPTVGTTLMGYVVGDYVGRATSAGTIHITTYMWPATNSGAVTATAFAWHWTLDGASLSLSLSTDGVSSTVVSVVVESASVRGSRHAMETMSMTEKLRCVGRWQHACEMRLAYHKQQ